MKIAFFSHSPHFMGAERALYETIVVLKKSNIDSIVFVPESGELENHLHGLGIKTYILKSKLWIVQDNFLQGLVNFFKTVLRSFSALKILKQEKVDVLYSNTITTPIGMIIHRLTSIPHI